MTYIKLLRRRKDEAGGTALLDHNASPEKKYPHASHVANAIWATA